MPQGVFIDTWGWIALGHCGDSHHQTVSKWYRDLQRDGARVYTSDYILDEVMTLLFRRESFSEALRFLEGVFASAERGHITIEQITSSRFAQAWELRRRFQDKPRISFTDLTSMALMMELGVSDVLTEDEHFLQIGLGFQKVP